MSLNNGNFFQIEGHLGSKPRVVETDKSKFTALSVATNSYVRKEDGTYEQGKTNWFDTLCFSKLGSVAEGLESGDRVLVSGYLSETKIPVEDKSYSSIRLIASKVRKLEKISPKPIDDGLPSFSSGEEVRF